MPIAYIFPGQGSQYPGMGKNLAENFAAAREIFEEADEALGFSISKMCFEGSAEELQLTENTQPAVLTVSIAAWRAFQSEAQLNPVFVAGHSLGEYSANVAAGSLSIADAVRTVRKRGQYMQEAVPVGTGAMAAVLGADIERVGSVCREASAGQVCSPANINSGNQVVIAGDAEAVARATQLLQGVAKRVVPLNVSAPFHCELMMPAQKRLAEALELLALQNPRVPVVTNVSARPAHTSSEIRSALIKQVSSPVRWFQSMQFLKSEGVDTVVELGPGKVLCGLMRQIDREVKCLNIEDWESLKNTCAGLAA